MAEGLELRGISKSFGSHHAVRDVSLRIADGEFFTLMGPSGCGKTTLLRMVGGFETPGAGEIRHGGERIDGLPPFRRRFNMVFQRYALFPHLNVRENVSFGLEMKKLPRAEIARRVDEMLALVRMQGYEERSVTSLSGGQQQRVALARALVNHPSVLLLDEPLSALDLKLRQQMQEELRSLQRRLGITFLLVTHDQEEALALSDRVAVMNEGRVEQAGTAREIYEKPATDFVARFVGTVNRIESVLIRPEKLALSRSADGGNSVSATVRDRVYLGPVTRYSLSTDAGESLTVTCPSETLAAFAPGDRVFARWKPEDAIRVGRS